MTISPCGLLLDYWETSFFPPSFEVYIWIYIKYLLFLFMLMLFLIFWDKNEQAEPEICKSEL